MELGHAGLGKIGEIIHPSLPFGWQIAKQPLPTRLLITSWSTSKQGILGFPGGAVVKNPPANVGDMGSSSGPGRSHLVAVEQLSPCATTTEPAL